MATWLKGTQSERADGAKLTNRSRWGNAARTGTYCALSLLLLSLVTWAAFLLHLEQLTLACIYLLIVVGIANFQGFWQATIASCISVLLLDYYFEPPLFSFRVASSGIFVALVTFEFTALVISRLHMREVRIEKSAAAQRAAMEQLYELGRSTLLLDMRRRSRTATGSSY